MPKVSVVIPTYNNAHYIGAALDSVFAQSTGDFEVIVVDDGSTDDTRGVLEAYGRDIRYHWQENGGLAVAFNSRQATC
jgi:glycosyltransferase involved in cell wall biosynthesis